MVERASAEALFKVYTAARILGGRGGSRDIARVASVSERTAQRCLRILVDSGFVEARREGARVLYRAVKPMTEGDARRIASGEALYEPTVYRLAREVDDIISEGGFRADLVGAAKIHLMVPTHSRITHDVDIVVAREHSRMLAAVLKHALGLIPKKASGTHVDYRFTHPSEDINIDLAVDGFREEGRLVWSLAPVLRRIGRLSLEHAVVAKLVRRSFEYRSDAYDVAVSLPHIDAARAAGIASELAGELASRIPRHLSIVEGYIESEYSGAERDILMRALSRLRAAIYSGVGGRWEERTQRAELE